MDPVAGFMAGMVTGYKLAQGGEELSIALKILNRTIIEITIGGKTLEINPEELVNNSTHIWENAKTYNRDDLDKYFLETGLITDE